MTLLVVSAPSPDKAYRQLECNALSTGINAGCFGSVLHCEQGQTLSELLIVLAVGAILVGLAAPPVFDWYSQAKVESDISALYQDIRWAQIEAEKQGEVAVEEGRIKRRRIFVALDSVNRRYSIWRWQDANGDGVPEAGEFSADLSDGPESPLRRRDLEHTTIGFVSEGEHAVKRKGCSNSPGAPARAVFGPVSCPEAICDGCQCIRFNGRGFFEGMNNAAIYLTNNTFTAALNINLAGTPSICRWDSAAGEWRPVR